MPTPIFADNGSLKNSVKAEVVPTHFGPVMLIDLSTRKMMSSGTRSAFALVEVHGPESASSGTPASGSMPIPPTPPVPPVPPLPDDVLALPPVVASLGAALHPHHAAVT